MLSSFWRSRSHFPCSALFLLSSLVSTKAFLFPPSLSSSVHYRSIMSLKASASVRHMPSSTLPSWMSSERTRVLTETDQLKDSGKCVVYWMQRDVRVVDNWAMLYASHLARQAGVPLRVVYCLPPPPASSRDGDDSLPPKILLTTSMTERYGSFLLGGLELVQKQLKELRVPLHVVKPPNHDQVGETLCEHLDEWQPRVVLCDTSPLVPYRTWLELQLAPLLSSRSLPLIHVDAHNIVPVWHASPKREIGARTLRPRLHRLMPLFLTEYPEFSGNAHIKETLPTPDFNKQDYITFLCWDDSVKSVEWAQPGTDKANQQFDLFVDNGLKRFDELRNDPNYRDVCSNLSPWINHGHVSFQTLARKVKKLNKHANGTAAYIEEGVVRRELSDNFVFYTPDVYDSLQAALGWAQETLETHSSDEREWLFSLEELENSLTHDDLWNAAQMQLVQEGKLHGFLRMYWAKKILEWTESPEVALRTAQFFNDKYALDGIDPNGFVGVGWSIMGIHDQGWKEREIFGKIRYMNYAGCKRKFDVASFVRRYPGAEANAVAAAKKHGKQRENGNKQSVGSKRKSPN